MNTVRFIFLLILLFIARLVSAASIQWDTPQNISGAVDVITEGDYFGTWSPGNASIPVGTINGVQMRGNDLEISTSGFAASGAAFGTHTTADATYNRLLEYGAWSNGTSAGFTLNGTGRRPLTPGRQFLVQIWVSDARAEINGRTATIGSSATLTHKTATGMGQYVIGRFTADAASQAISISANVSAQVNLVQVRDITPPESMTRRERWKTLKYGIFSHYTYALTGDPVTAGNGFNAQAYANDVAQAGAQYVVWTAWHANMYPMFPSMAAEKYGYSNRCSQRDTVSDMIDAVRAKGIRVFLYVHPYQPLTNDMALHNNYINELFAEVVDRYGPRIDGLWIDENQISSDQDSFVDYTRLITSIKSRNPDLVTMQNGGQLYTADMGGPEVVGSWNYGWSECMYNLASPGTGPGSEDMLRTVVLEAASNFEGGGVHWSVDGVLNGGLVETSRLFALGQYITPIRASICETKPSNSFPPPYKDGRTVSYNSVDWVATEATDDSKEYIHVLKPLAGTLLVLPNPADGKIFSSAKLLASGNAVGLVQNPYDGVQLTLQGSDVWSPLDTVIELTVASKGGPGHVNDTSGSVTYSGTSWSYQEQRGNGEFANDAHLATADGDSFTFTFNGTDTEYIATRGVDRGRVEIYIDEILQSTVDLSSGTPTGSRQAVFSKSGLARGTHTLKGIKRSGAYLEVDCFKVTDLINDSDTSMNGAFFATMDYGVSAANYAGPTNLWQPGNGGWLTPATGSYPATDPSDGDYFEFTFQGTGADCYLTSAYGSGAFVMYLDGVKQTTLPVSGTTTYSVSGRANGTHTIKGVTATTNINGFIGQVNGFRVTRPDAWTAASGRGYGEIGDDVHYTDVNSGCFSWNFNGSGVEVITTRDSDARMAWFGVSGMGSAIGARRQNFSLTRQTGSSVFSLPNLFPGSYNLSVTHGANTSGLNFSFARLAIDAVRVYKGQSLSALSLSWGASGAGGSGTWDTNTTANWFDSTSAVKWPAFGGTKDVASFGGTAGTVTLSGSTTANRIQFQITGFTIQGGTLTLNGSAPVVTTASAVSATISSTLAGGAGLIKNGSGTLTLSGPASYTGATKISSGTLVVQNTSQSSSYLTEGGAVLECNVAIGSRDLISTIFTGRGTLRKTGVGTLVLTGTNTYSGATAVNSGTLQIGNGGTSGTLGTGNVTISSMATLEINRSDSYGTPDGQTFGGAGTLIKNGSGNMGFNNTSGIANQGLVSGLQKLVLNGGTVQTGGWAQWNANLDLTVNGPAVFEMWNTTTSLSYLSGNGTVKNSSNWSGYAGGASFASNNLTIAGGNFSGTITDNGIGDGGNTGTSGDTRINLFKSSGATLTLSGTTSYSGNTTVQAGTLRLGNGSSPTNLADAADVIVYPGAMLDLAYVGTDRIGRLWVDGLPLPPGIYTSASGFIIGNGTLTVLNGPPSANYATWSGRGFNDLMGGPSGDDDKDSVSNLLEYVLGGNPRASSRDTLPTATFSSGKLVFTFRRVHSSAADTTQVFQYGTDLLSWTDVPIVAGGGVVIQTDTPQTGTDTVAITLPGGSPRMFGRLKISR